MGFGSLYIDYVEVYDEEAWSNYINDPVETAERIKIFIRDYLDCDIMKILSRYKEPASIDTIIPIETIRNLIKEACSPPGDKISFKKNTEGLQRYENR